MGSSRAALAATALFVVSGCSNDPGTSSAFEVVAQDQRAALLSVWASGPNDVWTVGGDARDGSGPIVSHYDGNTWTKLDSTLRNTDLWWVFGFKDGPVFMSGSSGTILEFQNGTFTKMVTPGTLIVFGMWGADPSDLWAVGGSFGGGGFAWHYDGTAWTASTQVPADITSQGRIWKVNGRSSTDLWMTGTTGSTFHWDGGTLTRIDAMTDSSLFSVAAQSNRMIAAGGDFDGALFENTDGSTWTSVIPQGGPVLRGVAAQGDKAIVVGEFGAVLSRGTNGVWSTVPPVTDQNLHATFIDPEGNTWAVGGQFDQAPTTSGVLIHQGLSLQGSFQ